MDEILSGLQFALQEMHKGSREQEKSLKRIILQAAAADGERGDYRSILERAIGLLMKLQGRLKREDPQRKHNGLNFCDGRGGELLWTRQLYSPLMHACETGTKEMVELLFERGAKVYYPAEQHSLRINNKKQTVGSRMTALHVACIQGRADVVQLIIMRATENMLTLSMKHILNSRTKDKWTPLMYAVKEGHTEVVKVLLEHSEVEILATNKKGQTALHIAGSHGRLECLQMIHARLDQEGATKESIVSRDNNPYLALDKKGFNVIHRVCKGPKRIYEGANISVKILEWIFQTMPHLDTPELHNLRTVEEGYSSLLLACDCNNRDLVEYLLKEKGVDVQSTTNDGKTGLHLAALHDYPDIADLLLDSGISVTAQDNEYKRKNSEEIIGEDTALHIAVRKSSSHVEDRIRQNSEGSGLLNIRNKLGEVPNDVRPEEIIPQEILKLGDAAVKRYRELLRKGKEKKMPRCNLIALGEQRVGKTCLLCLLMGGKFIPDRDPTRGIDNERVDVTTTSVSLSSETWQKIEPEDVARSNDRQFTSSIAEDFSSDFASSPKLMDVPEPHDLLKQIKEIEEYLQETEAKLPRIPRPKRPAAAQNKSSDITTAKPKKMKRSEPEPQRDAASEDVTSPAQPERVAERQAPKEQPVVPKRSVRKPNRRDSPYLAFPPSTRPGRAITQAIGLGLAKEIVSTAKKGSATKEPVLQYNTLDFAGQREYRAMHHCFIVRRAIYLVVFNLQLLKQALYTCNAETETALEEITYWMNSIHAHVHKMGQEPHLKRMILVGTHRSPPGQEPISDEELSKIDAKLCELFKNTPILDDVFRAGDTVWTAAIESSLDGEDQREESGASPLQKAIHEAWNELPFKDEAYPTTWLRFEAFLQRKRGTDTQIVEASSIKKEAKEKFGIGDENEEDIELALGFFHDIGSLVYPRKLPKLYLSDEQQKALDNLILLDPNQLTKMMRIVMELKMGRGCTFTNQEKKYLEETGRAKLSLLRKCWQDYRDDFDNLILMLQSFCLVFPLPAPTAKLDTPTTDTEYLIPSKLCLKKFHECHVRNFNFSFEFDFGGFLPEEVYHRLLCLMLKQVPGGSNQLEGKFTAKYFKIYDVKNCNWVVQMKNSKLRVWVKHSESCSYPPSSYVNLIHMDYLQKICNENGSSLQGLKYIGGPVHQCSDDKCEYVVPCASFPDEKEVGDRWKCRKCLESYDIENMLNPEYSKVNLQSSVQPLSTSDGILKEQSEGAIQVNKAECVIVAQTVHLHNQGSADALPQPCVQAVTEQLRVDDIRDNILEDMANVTTEWFFIGLALGLKDPTLKEIEVQSQGNISRCKYEMLKKWLSGADDCKSPTRANLATALRSKYVQLNSVAEEIEKRT